MITPIWVGDDWGPRWCGLDEAKTVIGGDGPLLIDGESGSCARQPRHPEASPWQALARTATSARPHRRRPATQPPHPRDSRDTLADVAAAMLVAGNGSCDFRSRSSLIEAAESKTHPRGLSLERQFVAALRLRDA